MGATTHSEALTKKFRTNLEFARMAYYFVVGKLTLKAVDVVSLQDSSLGTQKLDREKIFRTAGARTKVLKKQALKTPAVNLN